MLLAVLAVAFATYVFDCGVTMTAQDAMQCCKQMPCSSHGHHDQNCCKSMPTTQRSFVQSSSAHVLFAPVLLASAACWRRIACSLCLRWQDRSAMSCASTYLFPIPSTSSYLVLSPVASAALAHTCAWQSPSTGERNVTFSNAIGMRRTGAALHLLRTIGKRTRSCPRDGSAPLSRRWTALLQLRHHDS